MLFLWWWFLLTPEAEASVLISQASQVVPLTADVASAASTRPTPDLSRMVLLTASIVADDDRVHYASLGGEDRAAVSPGWTANDALWAARLGSLCAGNAPRSAVVLGGGVDALRCALILAALGVSVVRTSPRDTAPGVSPFLAPADIAEASNFDLILDFAGDESSRDPRYLTLTSPRALAAIENGLFADADAAPEADHLPLDASLLHVVHAALPRGLSLPAPRRDLFAFNVARLRLGADAVTDAYLDFLTWPRDVETGRRLGIDLLLADDPFPSSWPSLDAPDFTGAFRRRSS